MVAGRGNSKRIPERRAEPVTKTVSPDLQSIDCEGNIKPYTLSTTQ